MTRLARNEFAFEFKHLDPEKRYYVAARLTSKTCKTEHWQTSPVQITAPANEVNFKVVTSKTTLEVFSAPRPVAGEIQFQGQWGKYSLIDTVHHGNYIRTFRWTTQDPGATHGRWEVSHFPMGSSCELSPNVLRAKTVSYYTPPSQFEIHFLDDLKPGSVHVGDVYADPGVGNKKANANIVVPKPNKSSGDVDAFSAAQNDTAKGKEPNAGSTASAAGKKPPKITEDEEPPFKQDPRMFFVRLVALDENGTCLGSSNNVTIRLVDVHHEAVTLPSSVPTFNARVVGYNPFYLGPRSACTKYKATTNIPSKELAALQLDSEAKGKKVGETFYVCPEKDGDGFDDMIISGLEGGFGLVVDVVGWGATALVDIKHWIEDTAAKIVETVTLNIVHCGPGTPCRLGLRIGLEVALTTMGIPPTIPNFKELVENGKDYLIDEMMKAAHIDDVPCVDVPGDDPPCPREEVEKLVDKLIKQVELERSQPENGGYFGYAMVDPDWLGHPASIDIEYSIQKSVTSNDFSPQDGTICTYNTNAVWVPECVLLDDVTQGPTHHITRTLTAYSLTEETYVSYELPPRAKPKTSSFEPSEGLLLYSNFVFDVPAACGTDGVFFETLANVDGYSGYQSSIAGAFAPCRKY